MCITPPTQEGSQSILGDGWRRQVGIHRYHCCNADGQPYHEKILNKQHTIDRAGQIHVRWHQGLLLRHNPWWLRIHAHGPQGHPGRNNSPIKFAYVGIHRYHCCNADGQPYHEKILNKQHTIDRAGQIHVRWHQGLLLRHNPWWLRIHAHGPQGHPGRNNSPIKFAYIGK